MDIFCSETFGIFCSEKLQKTPKIFYILSKNDLPDADEYGGLDLIENGVGQVRSFLDNFNREKKIYILAPIIITFLLEIWPLKSTGAIFTTWNGTLFWIDLSFALTLRYKKNIY